MLQQRIQRLGAGAAILFIALAAFLASSDIAQAAEQLYAPDTQTQQIFALPGVLRPAVNQPYDTELVTPNGDVYAVVGETPQVESQLSAARSASPPPPVKVWGTLYPNGRMSNTQEIVVSAVQVSGPQPTPTPATPRATVTSPVINVRAGPSTDYPIIGSLNQGQACDVVGRNRAGTWWNLSCANNFTGWVADQLVSITGSTSNIPVIQVAPPPVQPTPVAPQPAICSAWNARFFANRDLLGSPVVNDCIGAINFNWGTSAPYAQMPPNNWSATFERNISFSPGNYRFTAVSDDGVRVYVDGQRIIDGWREQSPTQYTSDQSLSGTHTIRVEYFQAGAGSSLVLNIDLIRAAGGTGDWQASYWNNVNLSGGPSISRPEARDRYPLDRNWGAGSPVPGVIDIDNWSARWVGTFYFDPGDYVFQAAVDDGVRVYIDGLRVIDAWSDGYKEPSNTFRGVGGGNHQITVEYYERTGGAALRVNWYRSTGGGGSSGGGGGGGGGSGGGTGGIGSSLDE